MRINELSLDRIILCGSGEVSALVSPASLDICVVNMLFPEQVRALSLDKVRLIVLADVCVLSSKRERNTMCSTCRERSLSTTREAKVHDKRKGKRNTHSVDALTLGKLVVEMIMVMTILASKIPSRTSDVLECE